MPKKKVNEATVEPSLVNTAAVPAVKKTRSKASAQANVEKAGKPVAAQKKAAVKVVVPATTEKMVASLRSPAEAVTPPSVVEVWQIEELAYRSWLDRGCPAGSPEEDWYRAEKELFARAASAK